MFNRVKFTKKKITGIMLLLLAAVALFACEPKPKISPTDAPNASGMPNPGPEKSELKYGSLAVTEVYSGSILDNWIEIRNQSSETVSLNGVIVNVKFTEKAPSAVDIVLEHAEGREAQVKLDGYSLKPDEYLVVCGGDKKLGSQATVGENTTVEDGLVYVVDQNFFVIAGDMRITVCQNDTTVASMTVPGDLKGEFSYGINGSGELVYFMTPTPGSRNGGVSEKSADKFNAGNGLKINEYMNKNRFVLYDEDGDATDWAEIKNYGTSAINLANFGLTDNFSKPYKWTFPEITLEPGEILIVYLSGKDKPYVSADASGSGTGNASGSNGIIKTVHASFKLGDTDDGIMLTNTFGTTLDSVELVSMHGSLSYGRSVSDTDKWLYFSKPTPGTENHATGYETIVDYMTRAEDRVFISEVCSVSSSSVKKLDADDWIELYNNSDADVNLKGWSITKNEDKPDFFTFPDVTVKAHGYLVIKAGEEASVKAGSLDAGFKISSSGATIYLYDSEKCLVDSFETGIQRAGVTSGRIIEDGKLVRAFFATATKGKANAEGRKSYAAPVTVTSDSGTLNAESHCITLATAQSGARIYYTLDGTTPTEKSKLYTEPFTVTKSCVVKAFCVADDCVASDVATKTFICDERTHSLNIVCVSSDPDGLFSYETGIFADGPGYTSAFPHLGANFWQDWERACTFEYYSPEGELEIEFDAGMKVHGSWSRGMESKAFQVKLKEAYGPTSVYYPFFGDDGVKYFTNLLVRSGGQSQTGNYITDAYVERAVEGQMNLAVHDETPVALYINGEYFGMYFLREKLNESYYYAHDGIEEDNLDAIKGNTIVETGDLKLQKEVISYIKNHDMSTDAALEYIESVVDIDEWMNYWVVVTFFGNGDTGNIRKYTAKDGSVKWRWLLYDQDLAMMPKEADNNILAKILDEQGHGEGKAFYNYLSRALLIDNQKTRKMFIERYAELMQTVLSKERLLAVFNAMREQVADEMKYHCEVKTALTYSKWEKNMDTFAGNLVKRWDYCKKYLQSCFGLSDKRMAELFPEEGQGASHSADTEPTATPTPVPTATPAPTATPTQAVPMSKVTVDENLTCKGEKIRLFESSMFVYGLQHCDVYDITTGSVISSVGVSDSVIAHGLFEKNEQYLIELADGRIGYSYKWNFSERPLISEIKYDSGESKDFKYMIFIGDSRFRGMRDSIEGETVIAKNGEGYDFLVANIDQVTAGYTKGAVIVIGLGINDTWHVDKYISFANELAKTYSVAFVNIGPVDEPRSVKWDYNYFNSQLESFNKKLKAGLSEDVILLDVNSYLHQIGFDTLDGIHYVGKTYRNIYNFIRGSLIKE